MINGTPAVQALRQRLGPQLPLIVCSADASDIPLNLRPVSDGNLCSISGPCEDIIAVNLGATASDLAVLACRSIKEMEAFRQCNPVVQTGLVTIFNDWHLLWLCSDERPENVIFEDCMWLTRGAIPISSAGQNEAAIQTEGQAVKIAFANVEWPERLSSVFRIARLKRDYGQPFRKRRGRKVLNAPFWANFLVEVLGISYHRKLREFQRKANNRSESLCDEAMVGLVSEVLLKTAGLSSESFAIDDLKPSRIGQLVKLMKLVPNAQWRFEPEGLETYCLRRLQRQYGVMLTTAEIWLDYGLYCQERKLPAYSKGQFFRRLPAHILKLFNLTRSHDIRQKHFSGKARRGFRGVGFAVGDPKQATQ